MENLTLAHKVIKPHTVDPLEGHTVVVFERVGEAGEEFRFEIEPGMRVPRTRLDLFKWLRGGRGGANYFAYAVNGDPELRLKFSTPVKMDNQAHTFILVTTLSWFVAEPRRVVTRRNDDPVRKLRDEIGSRLQHELAGRSWISIRNEFRELSREVVGATIESLRQFASRYGLAIHDLALACDLHEQDFADARNEAAIEQQIDIHQREADFERLKISEELKTSALRNEQLHRERLRQQEREDELATLERMQTLRGAELQTALDKWLNMRRVGAAATDAAVAAIASAGGAIRTPAELLQAFTALQGAVSQMRGLTEGSGGGASDGGAFRLLGSGSQNGAAALVAEMFARTDQMACPIQKKQQFQSAILHLVGELLLDGGAAPATIEQYCSRIDELRTQGGLPVEHFDYLKRFVDADRLRNELR